MEEAQDIRPSAGEMPEFCMGEDYKIECQCEFTKSVCELSANTVVIFLKKEGRGGITLQLH
jgi:hypothetical protein